MEEENKHNSQRTHVQIKYRQKRMCKAGSHMALLRLKTKTQVNETKKLILTWAPARF